MTGSTGRWCAKFGRRPHQVKAAPPSPPLSPLSSPGSNGQLVGQIDLGIHFALPPKNSHSSTSQIKQSPPPAPGHCTSSSRKPSCCWYVPSPSVHLRRLDDWEPWSSSHVIVSEAHEPFFADLDPSPWTALSLQQPHLHLHLHPHPRLSDSSLSPNTTTTMVSHAHFPFASSFFLYRPSK